MSGKENRRRDLTSPSGAKINLKAVRKLCVDQVADASARKTILPSGEYMVDPG
jgi:hypothetical protein